MTVMKRAVNIIIALLTAAVAVLILSLGDKGFLVAGAILSFSLIIFGLRNILFYFQMACHMVDGRRILYIGVIALNLGVLALYASQDRGVFVVLYLLGAYAFAGLMDILRAREAKSYDSPVWKQNLAEGIVEITFALAAAVFGFILGDMWALTLIYAIGLFYSALVRLVSAFRKTAIVYIQ